MHYIATQLENYTLMAAAHGDVRLVQPYLSTPSIEKVGPRDLGRYVLRRAIDGKVKGPSRM